MGAVHECPRIPSYGAVFFEVEPLGLDALVADYHAKRNPVVSFILA